MNTRHNAYYSAPGVALPFFPGDETALHLAAVEERVRAARAAALPGPAAPPAWLRALSETAQEWWLRVRTRRQLATLGPRLLADVGFSDADVMQETAKWFWQR